MTPEIQALHSRFNITYPDRPTTWRDIDPVERQQLWRRLMRKARARAVMPQRTIKPALVYPDPWG